jgi:Effector-associated domain 1
MRPLVSLIEDRGSPLTRRRLVPAAPWRMRAFIWFGCSMERLSAALRDAFSLDEFSRLLYYAFRRRLDDITLGGSFETRVFDVILEAERDGWVQGLISAACDYRPRDAALRALAVDAGLSSVDAPTLERAST